MSETPVLLDIDSEVATVTLNDPERRNAFSRDVAEALDAALEEVDGSDARCLVVEGAGDAFCAGGDIDRMVASLDTDVPIEDRYRDLVESTNRTMQRVADVSLPTIAKIDGPAVGAGANLAILCDLQLASDRASIGFVFRQVGLGVDTGTSYQLPRLVGENVAKELVYTGQIVDAERANELGLFNHVYPTEEFDERASELVDTVATGPTVALKHDKRLLEEGLDKSLERAMTDEAAAQGLIFETDDHEEGVRAFTEGRSPQFQGK